QEAPEGQHVGVDHPGQRGLGETQVGLDGWQRHVHDVGVEHDHQVTEAQYVQRPPAGLLVVHGFSCFGGLSPSSRTDLTGYDNSSQRISCHSSCREVSYPKPAVRGAGEPGPDKRTRNREGWRWKPLILRRKPCPSTCSRCSSTLPRTSRRSRRRSRSSPAPTSML